ncbi:hypothetical protein [Paenibacillus sp. YN15]|uniref:hypothetical protein n=1 Tax=Paenibacillus sp. YN15 TaxID=1742774 RepID=UPI000DCAF42E|nr:hypothetical protein [Paenibacillus sp. YN15]RAU91422.1 hypothetical protein DQG13_29460 [Paenibacillus sp. YN15]
MITVMYLVLSCTLTALIVLVDMGLQKQGIFPELLSVFSKNENMDILLYALFWAAGLVWGGVADYRFHKAKKGSQS